MVGWLVAQKATRPDSTSEVQLIKKRVQPGQARPSQFTGSIVRGVDGVEVTVTPPSYGDASFDDSKEPIVSQGIYSVRDGQWISVPRRKAAKIDDAGVRDKYADMGARVEQAIASGDRNEVLDRSAAAHRWWRSGRN